MNFSEKESILLIKVLQQIIKDSQDKIKQETLNMLIEKIHSNEYIKGRMLNLLYSEIKIFNYKFNDERDQVLQHILGKIKFKATPR